MQWIIALGIVLLAALFVVWNILRPLVSRKQAGCSSGCGGCASTPQAIVPGRLALPQIQAPNKM